MTISSCALVCTALADDCAALEGDVVEALSEAATYRQCLLVTLAQLHATDVERIALRRRLRQLMGAEDWHPENA